ncbi:murein biosynthesis integral membrane protein MurJ [Patescibacteria group bacterium]|nr:murein biosynthesis integral membrane protein MurJ [Patescibacteria group bacterium]
MVERILNLIHREIRGVHEAAYLLGLFALFSQVLALIRDRLLASSFGAGSVLDVYYAAFRIPDVIFVSVASLVSIYVLIPFLAEKSAISEDEERKFISTIFSAFALIILFISAVMFLFTPQLLGVIFPGLVDSPLYSDLVILTRILLLQPILLGISSLFGSITQTRQRFILYALSPLLYNLGIIGGILFLYPLFGIPGLGYGVVLGALLHLVIQLPFIIKTGFVPRFSFSINLSEVKKVVFLSLPRTLALSANQIALLFLISFASLMAVGSITVFNLSFNLQAVPLSIIAVSYSVAAFPTLARLFSNGEQKQFLEQMLVAARHILFWSTPAIALFVVLRAQIVRVVLGSGAFDWADTRLTAAVLALFAISLTAQGLNLLFIRGYYASGNTKKPLIINVISSILIVAFSYLFIKLFATFEGWRFFFESLLRVEDLAGTEILMLPLGYSLAVIINAIVFWIAFQKDFKSFSFSLSTVFFQSLSAAIVLGFVAYQFLEILDNVFDINTFWGIFLQGALSGMAGIIAAVILLKLTKSKELSEVWKSLHHKFWKTRAVASEQTEL